MRLRNSDLQKALEPKLGFTHSCQVPGSGEVQILFVRLRSFLQLAKRLASQTELKPQNRPTRVEFDGA